MPTTSFDKEIILNEDATVRLLEILKTSPPPLPQGDAKLLNEKETAEWLSAHWTHPSEATISTDAQNDRHSVTQTLDKRLIEAIRKSAPQKIEIETDANGTILIDKDKHPELYDWAVNG
jgi:hypothetical protein